MNTNAEIWHRTEVTLKQGKRNYSINVVGTTDYTYRKDKITSSQHFTLYMKIYS